MAYPAIFDEFILRPSCFDHQSRIHGIGHTYRVMVHVYFLCHAVSYEDILLPALAAAYVHDMARRHDGFCDQHGYWAANSKLPAYRQMFMDHGITEEQLLSMETAISQHSRMEELDRGHRDYVITAILKDADALDRIRLGQGNLDAGYLRFAESREMIGFASALYQSCCNTNFTNFTAMLEHARKIIKK